MSGGHPFSADRSEAETHDVRWTSVLGRPERSGDRGFKSCCAEIKLNSIYWRRVAQLGRALRSGRRGRGFKSRRADKKRHHSVSFLFFIPWVQIPQS